MAGQGLSLKQNMLWNSVGSMVYLGCQWLITVVVVRLSGGYDAAGVLALGMSVSNIFSPIGYYKIRPYQVSDVDEEFTPGQYIAFRIVTVGFALAIMVVYGLLTCPGYTIPCVFLYGIYSLGPVFVDVVQGIDQQRNRMDIIGKSLIVRGFLSLASFVVVMKATGSLLMALLAMTVLTFAVIALYDLRETEKLGVSLKPDFGWKAIRTLLVVCFPAVVALFFSSAVPSLPRQVLGNMYGEAALGVYASVASPVLIIQMGAQYLYAPVLGVLAQSYKRGDAKKFVKIVLAISLGIVAIALVGIVVFLFLGGPLLSLMYGDSILPYLYLLNPLVICTAMVAFAWFLGDLLIAIRDMTGNFIAYLIAFVICLVTMNPFIALWELNGASFVVIAAYAGTVLFAFGRVLMRVRKLKEGECTVVR